MATAINAYIRYIPQQAGKPEARKRYLVTIVLSERAGAGLGRGHSKWHATPVWYCPGCDACALTPCSVPGHGPGVRYASKAEAWYWWDVLRPAAAAGTLFALERQVPYRLRVRDLHGIAVDFGRYTADFRYADTRGVEHVVDVKGALTRDGKLRLGLMRVCHGIVVELVHSTPPRRWLME